eukprot:CAMPEP_0197907116 /NCGR_PEP_ID=MMETSP1439-20131203/64133_1 /TAXON_ID=66791 /ORGANISM="Gonyaulax spinifera, Strain CCMP409" /LENGTH=67 /DNA_ID=CAMNT_0043528525 /DNA_START=65 /DNA_END=265 /DNA_ORIENTATION=+
MGHGVVQHCRCPSFDQPGPAGAWACSTANAFSTLCDLSRQQRVIRASKRTLWILDPGLASRRTRGAS